MFFSINKPGPGPLLKSLTIKNFELYLDQGWKQHGEIFYKGYTTHGTLEAKILTDDFGVSEDGNYCILDFTNDFEIYHDDCRSFALYMGKDFVTNHPEIGGQQVYFDATVFWQNDHFVYSNKSSTVNGNNTMLSFDGVVDALCDYLVDCCKNLQTDLPIFTTYTRGMDSTLINSAFDYAGRKYTEHEINTPLQINHWAYTQLPITGNSQLQITGFYGDTVLMRNPVMVQSLLSAHDIDLTKEYQSSNGYTKPVYLKRYKKQMHMASKFLNRKDAIKHVYNQIVNNYEIWHYNDCLTFTPLKNNFLINTMLYADADTLLKQCLNAEVSRSAILRLNPKNIKRVRSQK